MRYFEIPMVDFAEAGKTGRRAKHIDAGISTIGNKADGTKCIVMAEDTDLIDILINDTEAVELQLSELPVMDMGEYE